MLTGVKDSSNDDVSFRFLVDSNKRAGHPLVLLTGQEVVVDGAYMAGADGSVPGLANVEASAYVRVCGKHMRMVIGALFVREQDFLADLCVLFSLVPQGVQGCAAGVGAFKQPWLCWEFLIRIKMPEPVLPLRGENVERIASVLKQAGLELKRNVEEVSASAHSYSLGARKDERMAEVLVGQITRRSWRNLRTCCGHRAFARNPQLVLGLATGQHHMPRTKH